MKLNFFQRTNQPAQTASVPSEKALGNRPAASSASTLAPQNPPARFSGLKSAKSGGGKSASSPSLLSHLPRAFVKQVSQRTASVVRRGKSASSNDLADTPSKASHASAPGNSQPGSSTVVAQRERKMLIGQSRFNAGIEAQLARIGAGTAPVTPQARAPLTPEMNAEIDAMLLSLSGPAKGSPEAEIERITNGDF